MPAFKRRLYLRPLKQNDLPYIMRYSRYSNLDGEDYYAACIASGAALGIDTEEIWQRGASGMTTDRSAASIHVSIIENKDWRGW